jgi:tRNA (cmo5U34)-methyltransferase
MGRSSLFGWCNRWHHLSWLFHSPKQKHVGGDPLSQFRKSHWSDSKFSQEYCDRANSYIPERSRLIEITQSLYRHLVKLNQPCRILDLGCGDGFMVQELIRVDDSIDATLVDGSKEMLEAARIRLACFERAHWVNASFQDLLTNDPLQNNFDFVLSSLAIHHLIMPEKRNLFDYVYHHLNPGGFFLNIDVVLSPTDSLEEWYLVLWQEWIDSHAPDSQKASILPVPQKYKDNLDNVPDPLLPQLQALEGIGFTNVDCYYKYGIFAMFGGSKIIARD